MVNLQRYPGGTADFIAKLSCLASAVTYCLQYGRAVWISPVYDDWGMIDLVARAREGLGFWSGVWNVFQTPLSIFWRPLHVLPFMLAGGESLVWVQIVKLAMIVGCGGALVWAARGVGLARGVAYLCGAIFFLHQCQVLGGEPDVMGDVIVTLAVILAVGIAGRYEIGESSIAGLAGSTALLTAFACLGKEAGVVIPAIPLVFGLTARSTLRRNYMMAAISGAITVAAYLFVRGVVLGLPFSDASPEWSFAFGFNIVKNVALLFGAFVCPVSTIQVFLGNVPARIAAGFISLFVAGTVAAGCYFLVQRREWNMPARVFVLFVLVQGPVLFFLHTNERNLSRSLPLGILASAFAIWALWNHASQRMKVVFTVVIGVWITFSQFATWEKVSGIIAMHERGKQFLDQVQQLMPVPPDREVLFAVEAAPRGYSEYRQPFWQHMPGTSDLGLQYRYHDRQFRSDFAVVDSPRDWPGTLPTADFWVDRDGVVVRFADATGAAGGKIEGAKPIW